MITSKLPKDCYRPSSGGKGNKGMFIEREPRICAAGIPTAQATETVADALQHYLLKDEVDALISDAIIPEPDPRPLPPLRKPIPLDMRFSYGPYGQIASLINPPNKTKFQSIVDDLKETSYNSYWNKPLGKVKDPVPMFPEGFDINGTTYGKPTFRDDLYDIIMPKVPPPDKTPRSKEPSVQIDRKYCAPPYRSDVTYGHRNFVDKRGRYAKCCLTDERVLLGTGDKTVMNTVQSNFLCAKQPRIGTVLAPNDNLKEVPEGFSFGILKPPDKLAKCLSFCELNEGIDFLRKCLKHLNTLRKSLRSRFLPPFFLTFYLNLKYFDMERTGWLPKDTVYKFCGTKLIRFDPALIEPLLSMWHAFDGSRIEYKTFVRVINYREPSPEIPKLRDIQDDCLDYSTTYREMVKPGQPPNLSPMAGLPSGRYFDLDYPITPEGCCRADRTCLPQESDMKSCINPSILTRLFVNHRDMYAKREPEIVRRVFEATGEKFTEEKFNTIWEKAKKLHSQGWVCYETFRQTMEKMAEIKKKTEN